MVEKLPAAELFFDVCGKAPGERDPGLPGIVQGDLEIAAEHGRDLFDLYWALAKSGQNNIRPPAIIDSFLHYMHQEGTVARRSEFIAILDGHLKDNGFCTDMNSLLRSDISYDPHEAGTYVIKHLLGLLPDVGEDHTSGKRKSKTNIKPGKS